jgi:hypothetical protein
MEKEKSLFERLSAINVNENTDTRDNLTYLTWSWAWSIFKKEVPDATYEVRHWDGKPYFYDENVGYMVETTVTAEGQTYEMWLPVMNSANKAMKAQPYTYKTKYGEKEVEAATMFDINKAIMRCLVKNIAMFGLGLYIYADEDLPQVEADEVLEKAIYELSQAKEMDDLRKLVLKYKNLQTNAQFIEAGTIARKRIEQDAQ